MQFPVSSQISKMTAFKIYKKEQLAVCRLLFSFLLGLCPFFLVAQNLNDGRFSEIAIGPSIIHEKLPEGFNYTPLFFTARFPIHQFNATKKGHFKIFVEPQFVLNNAPSAFPTTYEFGANLGFQYWLPFTKKNALSIAIGAGPHYLSLETSMQAKGFIFSDNFEIGYYHKVGERLGFSIKPRFRHISNAGFLSPNIGIDNLFLMVGVFWKKI